MSLIQRISRHILYNWMGWSVEVNQTLPNKCIICVAPHTSNWDFIIGKLYYWATGMQANFLMKKEWFVGPLGVLFRKMGGIPVERSKHVSLTEQLAIAATKAPQFALAITPEGTRSLNKNWKRGFYYIALKANIPILLYAIDFQEKKIICKKTINPSGNVEQDLATIMNYYKDYKGKHPENFAIEDFPKETGI